MLIFNAFINRYQRNKTQIIYIYIYIFINITNDQIILKTSSSKKQLRLLECCIVLLLTININQKQKCLSLVLEPNGERDYWFDIPIRLSCQVKCISAGLALANHLLVHPAGRKFKCFKKLNFNYYTHHWDSLWMGMFFSPVFALTV